jgi:hypothetical protein
MSGVAPYRFVSRFVPEQLRKPTASGLSRSEGEHNVWSNDPVNTARRAMLEGIKDEDLFQIPR